MAVYLPDPVLERLESLTIVVAKLVGSLFAVPVSSNYDILTVNGFDMRIISQCTALHYVIILSCAILLYTRHHLSYRLTGLLITIPIIVFANGMRLIVSGLAGSYSWSAFVLTHDYLWVAVFSLLVLGMWIVWAEKRFVVTIKMLQCAALVTVSCSFSYYVLHLVKPLYGMLIAKSSSMIFSLMLNDRNAGIIFDGEVMRYTQAATSFTANFTADQMALALFIGLSGSKDVRHMVTRVAPGLFLIVSINIFLSALCGAIFSKYGTQASTLFLWTGHGITLALVIAMGWGMHTKTADKPKTVIRAD